MIGSSKNNRENDPRKCFRTQEQETRVKLFPAFEQLGRVVWEWKIQVVICATSKGPRGKFKLLCKGKRGKKMASSWEKSLATIQEAQIAVSEVLGRLRFNTATFRGWNKVQATGRQLTTVNTNAGRPILIGRKFFKPSDVHPNSYPQGCTKGVGGGGWIEPNLEFLIRCNISKRFCLQWKAFYFLNKIRYILWAVAMLGAYDVTINSRHLGFY